MIKTLNLDVIVSLERKRAELKESITKFSSRLGLDKTAYSRIRMGFRGLPANSISKAAELLELSETQIKENLESLGPEDLRFLLAVAVEQQQRIPLKDIRKIIRDRAPYDN